MHIASDFRPEETAERSRTTERILDEVRTAHREQPIDLFLSYFYNAHFDPIGFDELRRLGIPTLNFYCNSIYQFEYVAAIAAGPIFGGGGGGGGGRPAIITLRLARGRSGVQMGTDPEIYHLIENVPCENKHVSSGNGMPIALIAGSPSSY